MAREKGINMGTPENLAAQLIEAKELLTEIRQAQKDLRNEKRNLERFHQEQIMKLTLAVDAEIDNHLKMMYEAFRDQVNRDITNSIGLYLLDNTEMIIRFRTGE